jgi:hypothetical protein
VGEAAGVDVGVGVTPPPPLPVPPPLQAANANITALRSAPQGLLMMRRLLLRRRESTFAKAEAGKSNLLDRNSRYSSIPIGSDQSHHWREPGARVRRH